MSDAELIELLGGPTRVAELLKLSDKGGVQRVSNWKRRGIPLRVLVDYPQIFKVKPAPAVPADEVPDAA